MDFVDRHWCMHGLLVNAAGHPCAVGPVVVKIPNTRCRTRWMLVHDSNWIGFISNVSVLRNNMELVKRSFVEAGQKSFPDARTSPRSELVRPSVPAIEISNDRNFARSFCHWRFQWLGRTGAQAHSAGKFWHLGRIFARPRQSYALQVPYYFAERTHWR